MLVFIFLTFFSLSSAGLGARVRGLAHLSAGLGDLSARFCRKEDETMKKRRTFLGNALRAVPQTILSLARERSQKFKVMKF